MTAPTHIIASISTISFFSLLVPAYRLSLSQIILASVCSLLPDIDNPRSFIGRMFFYLSGPLDRRFGHRTLTHSLAMTFLLTFTALLCLFIYSRSLTAYLPYVFTIFLAYFSHIFFDGMTKQGVLIYYPSRLWGVFPLKTSWRIRTGSRIEILFFAVFLVTSLIFLPLGQAGISRAFNKLFQGGSLDIRLKEFEYEKTNAALGYTEPQIDSLLKAGSIDPKQAEELKAKLRSVDIQEKKFKINQGFDE
jgi:inner membrane protein